MTVLIHQNLSTHQIYRNIGKRKQSIAILSLKQGSGVFLVNKREFFQYFQSNVRYINICLNVFYLLNLNINHYDIHVKVKGGGLSGQICAIRLALARILSSLNRKNKALLKEYKLLTRDARIKESKKYGLKKARKAPQYSKR
uniref:Small ribosomal subunit protein uS9c n=1 Tax=Pterocladiophila hemisphaerica TaxID=2712948 RepID=A0A6M3WWA0_9FLOR|nr:ribosomal protein S9 [Pterocladiophila hemisphaerica]